MYSVGNKDSVGEGHALDLVGVLIPAVLCGIFGLLLIALLGYYCCWRKRSFLCGETGNSPINDDVEWLATADEISIIELTDESDESSSTSSSNNSVLDNSDKLQSPQSQFRPLSPLTPTASHSRSGSFFSITEETPQYVSASVQTDPVIVTVISDFEVPPVSPIELFCEQVNGPCTQLEEQEPEPEEAATSHPAPPGSPRGRSLIHFEDFDKFAEHCKTQPILKPILENVHSHSSSCLATSSSSTTITEESQRPPPPRKLRKSNGRGRRTRSRPPSLPLASGESQKKKFFDSSYTAIEKDLKTAVNETREQIGEGQFLEPNLKQLSNSLGLIRILKEVLFCQNSSLLAENLTLTEFAVKNGIAFLQELQELSHFSNHLQIYHLKNLIRLAQQLVVFQYPHLKDFTDRESELIIGVDATPSIYGGYCVNLRDKTAQFYSIHASDLPWKIPSSNNADEFEMKNLLLALCAWSKEILEVRAFSVYTDNCAISRNNKHGNTVIKLVQHFRQCHGVTQKQSDHGMLVNRKKDLESFAKLIQPADELSRNEIQRCTDFLTRFYRINKENVTGTHVVRTNRKTNRGGSSPGCDMKYKVTSFYDEILHQAKSFVATFGCESCKQASEKDSPLNTPIPRMSLRQALKENFDPTRGRLSLDSKNRRKRPKSS